MNKKLYGSLAILAALALMLSACANPTAKTEGVWYFPWTWGDKTLEQTLGEMCVLGGQSAIVNGVTYPCPNASTTGGDTTTQGNAPATANGNKVAYMTEDLGLNVYKGKQLTLSTLAKTTETQIYIFHGDTQGNAQCKILVQTGAPVKPSAATWRLLLLTFTSKPDQSMIDSAVADIITSLGACSK